MNTKTLPDFTQGLDNLGFANYETYTCWDYYRNMQDLTLRAVDLVDLASRLKRMVNVSPPNERPTATDLCRALLTHALEQINYLEVAQAMFDEWRPAPK